MRPGSRVTLNVTFVETAPFGTVSLIPFGIDRLPPSGPMTWLAVAWVTGVSQRRPSTAVSVFVRVFVRVPMSDWFAATGEVAIGAVGASAHAAANEVSAIAPRTVNRIRVLRETDIGK